MLVVLITLVETRVLVTSTGLGVMVFVWLMVVYRIFLVVVAVYTVTTGFVLVEVTVAA